MLFSTTIFLFVFLPRVLAVYYNPIIRSRQFRNVFLLLASIFFYAWGEPFYVLLMLLSIVVNWGLGLLVDRFRNRPGEKAVLLVTVVYNLGVLVSEFYRKQSEPAAPVRHPRSADRAAGGHFLLYVPGHVLCAGRAPGQRRSAEKSAQCGIVHCTVSTAHRRAHCPL